jgi:ABC-2 type transport system ATP-binding protein
MTTAIEITHIEKQLGQFHLGPLSLSIPRGAIYGLIGANGAGKSTTLGLLMGMGQPDSGRIELLGRDIRNDEVAIKRRTAYVSPDVDYQAWGTVGRATSFISSFYPDWDQKRCERLQVEFGVNPAEKVSSLSFGARIKLALIMALSRDAELLLLDEPTVGLDPVSRRYLFTELLAFMQREDRTILISSHQLSDLERFADHVAIVDKGRLLAAGRTDELVERYCQLHVRSTLVTNSPGPGISVLKRDGDRAQLLLDLSITQRDALAPLNIEILSETPLTLEDLFLALLASQAAPVPVRNYKVA